jgi:catechol 2,3-dioxygenase-like lactoylglutathione lyase family enzyme
MYYRRLTRRQVLAALGAAGVPKAAAQDPLIRAARLDHVSILVADVEKSVAFYRRIFGHHVLKAATGQRRYFMLGTCYAAIAPAPAGEPRRVDHYCPGIQGFQAGGVKSKLEQAGIAARETGVGLYVTDPDNMSVQLWDDESWKLNKAAPEAGSNETPLFRPLGLDHLLLRASAPFKTAEFYRKLFGPEAERSEEPPRIWFQLGRSRLGLAPLGGQPPGVDHFCVLAESFDSAAILKRLEERGAVLDSGGTAASPQFRDPDGILVQVMARRG